MSSKRFLFIDVFRGWAVITMIETHAFNAWMDAGLRDSSWFPYLNLLNGFVAPSFLFIAGVSFAFVARARWDDITHWSSSLWRTARRLLMILGLGYWLHIPRVEWHGIAPHVVEADLAEFYRADILHTIAVSLILLHLLAFVTRKASRFVSIVFAGTVAALLFTPSLWKIDFHQWLHPALSNYLNGLHNPLFPLFPWMVFLWSGALIGFCFLDGIPHDEDKKRVGWIVGLGVISFTVAFISDLSPIKVFDYESFWLTSPNWVVMRLGILLVLFGGFWFLEHRGWHTSELVRRFGSQSLFAYVVHLMIIYSITGEKAGFPLLSQDQSILGTVVLFAILLAGMYFLTQLWAWGKNKLRSIRAAH